MENLTQKKNNQKQIGNQETGLILWDFFFVSNLF